MTGLCNKLSSYNIKPTIVQPDFGVNNSVFDSSKQKITIIDVGEIIISHPLFSMFNFLWQMKKHFELTEAVAFYQQLHDACFSHYRGFFTTDNDFNDALAVAEILNIICGAVYADRFMQACGKENLKKYNHWKLGSLLRIFISKAHLCLELTKLYF